jgi:hypothetical protein
VTSWDLCDRLAEGFDRNGRGLVDRGSNRSEKRRHSTASGTLVRNGRCFCRLADEPSTSPSASSAANALAMTAVSSDPRCRSLGRQLAGRIDTRTRPEIYTSCHHIILPLR